MVVLYEHRAREVEAMGRATTSAHRVSLQPPPAGCRLACVVDARSRARDRLDVAAREGRDTGQALHEVQRYPFGGQQPTRMTREEEHRGARLHQRAILHIHPDGDLRVELAEGLEGERDTCDNPTLPGH